MGQSERQVVLTYHRLDKTEFILINQTHATFQSPPHLLYVLEDEISAFLV